MFYLLIAMKMRMQDLMLHQQAQVCTVKHTCRISAVPFAGLMVNSVMRAPISSVNLSAARSTVCILQPNSCKGKEAARRIIRHLKALLWASVTAMLAKHQ